MKNRLFLIFIISLLFMSCKSTKIYQTTFNGMIYDKDNEPVPGVLISLDDGTTVTTDMYGRFYIDNLIINQEYTLTATKNDFEKTTLPFTFQNITQVAYLTMYSYSQLLTEAEKSLISKDYSKAMEYVTRAETCSKKSDSSTYLRAVIFYNLSNYDETISILNEMVLSGSTEPQIYLFLADIYQYKINNKEQAKKYLELYLKSNYDPEIESRFYSL